MIIKKINPDTLTLSELRSNSGKLYCITSEFNESYVMNSLIDQTLDFFKKDHVILMIDEGTEEVEEPVEKNEDNRKNEEPPVEEKPSKKFKDRNYKFNGMNDDENIRIAFSIASSKYGTIRVSFPNKEDAKVYFDYFREQFYNRDVSCISVESIYEDLGISKERIKEECPDAWKWGYMTLRNGGTCKYITDVRKNNNDKWFGFTFDPPIIINGLEESGWYAKKQEVTNAPF